MQELIERRGRLANEAQAILDAARTAGRSVTAEETTKFNAIHADIEGINSQLEMGRRQDALNAQLSTSQGRRTQASAVVTPTANELRAFFCDGERTSEMRDRARVAGFGNKNAYVVRLSERFDATVVKVGSANNGQDATQQNLIFALEEARLAFSGPRQFSTNIIRTATGNPIDWIETDETGAEGELVGEASSVSDTTLGFDRKSIGAYKFSSKALYVSTEFLQDAWMDAVAYIGRKLGERIGRKEAKIFTTGTGVSQPQGLVTGAFPVVLPSTPSYENLVAVEHSVDPAYRVGAKWSFSDDTLKAIKLLVDGNDRPLWMASTAGIAGSPQASTVLGYPYVIQTAQSDEIVFGDPSKFLIRDSLDLVVLRLDEIKALDGQVVFVAFSRSDSKVMDAGTHPIVVTGGSSN